MATKEELSALLDATAEGIVRLDAKGRITYVNRAAAHMLDYPPEYLLGQELLALTRHKKLDRSPCPGEKCPLLQPLLSGQTANVHSGIFHRRDGTLLSADCLTSPLLVNDQVQGVVVTMRDPLMFPQAKESWLHSRNLETIGRVTSKVVHDFNNLLTVVIGYGDLLLQKVPANDPARQYLEDILKVADRSAALAKKILSLSRQPVLCPQTLDLNMVVREFHCFFKPLLREDIDITHHLSPNLGHIVADAGQLEQVLMNLVLNARDAMPKGGQITIETANVFFEEGASFPPGGYVVLTVRDTGMGMSAEVGSHIFEPYFTTKAPGKGTGLGLANVQRIVLQNQGFIEVFSEPGHGTTFKVYFPHVEKAGEKQVPPADALPSYQGWETILVVVGDDDLSRMLIYALGNFGYNMLSVNNLPEALNLCLDYPGEIHLMLCDEMTQKGVPPEMIAHVSSYRPDMKFLFLSDPSQPSSQMGLTIKPIIFLEKPCNLGPLKQLIQAILTTNGTGNTAAGNQEGTSPWRRAPVPIPEPNGEPR